MLKKKTTTKYTHWNNGGPLLLLNQKKCKQSNKIFPFIVVNWLDYAKTKKKKKEKSTTRKENIIKVNTI